LFAIILLREARKYKKNKEEDPNNFLAAYISENPKRAFYPVKFIEELVVPSALYWFQQMSENNIIVPLSTPTVR
jgi:hypothetical protein